MVTALEPPIVPVTEPKFAPLFGQPAEEVQLPWPLARVRGTEVFLPVPLVTGS